MDSLHGPANYRGTCSPAPRCESWTAIRATLTPCGTPRWRAISTTLALTWRFKTSPIGNMRISPGSSCREETCWLAWIIGGAAAKFLRQRYASGAGVAPTGNFLKSIGACLLEKADEMPGMLEFVDIRPHLSLPAIVMDGGGTAGSTPG